MHLLSNKWFKNAVFFVYRLYSIYPQSINQAYATAFIPTLISWFLKGQ